jgi:large repetitive protein
MHRRRGASLAIAPALAVVLALGTTAGLTVPAAAVVAAPSWTTLEEFDAPSAWTTAAGVATVGSASSHVSGAAALGINYDVSGGLVEVGPVATPVDFAGASLSELRLAVRGDGTWNSVFIRLRDATGEVMLYPVTAMGFTGWQTKTVDLTAAPVWHDLGNDDGVVDYPASLYRIVVARNGAQPATGTVGVDLLEGLSDWELPQGWPRVFVPSSGEDESVDFRAGSAGDWRLTLTDELGATRVYSGVASVGQALTIVWDGRSGSGGLMRGNIRATLEYDTAPGGGLAASHVTAAVPYLAGAATHAYNVPWPGSIAGVNSFLTTIGDPVEVGRQARLMEDAFVRMAREEFEWKRIEPRKGNFEWARFDQAVEVARSHQIELLGKLVYSAPWASSAPSGTSAASVPYYPPKQVSDFAAYAQAVVHRYKDRVHVWEVWNEPNTSLFWKPGPNATQFAALLKAAYAAIKAEDPSATIVLGGLAGFDRTFLDGVRAAGAWASFDALGIHTYTIGAPEKSTAAAWLDQAQSYVERYGTKPIWITELGWSTYAGSGSGYIGVNETTQASYLARAYLDASVRGVAGIFWYDLIEDGTSTTSLASNYGLVEQSGRKKPAYTALQRVAGALDMSVSVGASNPSAAGQMTVVDPLDSIAGWSAVGLGSTWKSVSSTTARHSGTAALQLAYSFGSGGTGVELRRNLPLPGSPRAVSVWVWGDRSANPIYIKLQDATGEYFQGSVGSSTVHTWRRLTLYTDGSNANWKHWGGDNDGVIDYPVKLSSIYLFKGPMGVTSGTIVLDDVSSHTGPNIHGAVLIGHTMNTQALYRLDGGGPTTVRVADTQAYLQYGSGYAAVSTSGTLATVGLGATPSYVATHAGLSTTSFTPNGDGVNDTVDFRWISGDRSSATFQVIGPGHVLLRNIVAGLPYDGGYRWFTWDGTYFAGGSWHTATSGSYTLALWLHPPDGRLGLIARTVTIP